MKGVIFDLDQTIIDTSCAELDRKNRNWQIVYSKIPHFRIYDQVKEVINWILEQNFQICIVTKSPSNYCEKILKDWDININLKVCYHDVVNQKPSSEPIEKALNLMNLSANEVISLGDQKNDIIASNSANVLSVACLWGALNLDELKKSNPNFIINEPVEIIDIIKKLRGY